jgi:drug/metabolite transporter (DMT)-like permease
MPIKLTSLSYPSFITHCIFLFLVLIWGSSYFFMKQALIAFTPLQTAALRIAIAAIVLSPLALKHAYKIPKDKWKWVLLSGFLGNGIPALLFMMALSKIDSNIGGILNATTPIWVLVIGYLFFQKKVNANKSIGILIGFIGLCIFYISKGIHQFENLSYSLYILAATCLYGININLFEAKLSSIPSTILGYCSMLLVGLVYIILLIIGIDGKTITELPLWSNYMIYILIIAIIGTAFSNILFFVLVKRSNVNVASMVTYLMPFVSILIGFFIGEKIYMSTIICFLMILVGVWCVKKN